MHRIQWLSVQVDQINLALARCYYHLQNGLAGGVTHADVAHTKCTKPGGGLLLLRLLAKKASTSSAWLCLLLLLLLGLAEGARATKRTSGTRIAYD